jgi:hypothetical protein
LASQFKGSIGFAVQRFNWLRRSKVQLASPFKGSMWFKVQIAKFKDSLFSKTNQRVNFQIPKLQKIGQTNRKAHFQIPEFSNFQITKGKNRFKG